MQKDTPVSPTTSTAAVATSQPTADSTATRAGSKDDLAVTQPAAYSTSQLAERYGDAVYRIETSGCGVIASGSGFAIDAHHVVTNQHVVADDIEPTVVHRDGSRLQGQVIGWNIDPDIAVIRVSSDLNTTLDWAPTSTLEVGDSILGLGYPVPSTDFSAIPGTIISFETYGEQRRSIRTDASWDYGSSGGPALTAQGLIAGVVTQFAESDGRQNVPLAFTSAVLKQPIADIIANPSDVVSGCAGAGRAQYEPGYIEGLEDYYPDPYDPFWTAILMSVDYLTEDFDRAINKAYDVLALGLPVGLLISDDFPSLNPGYVVVYSGRFSSFEDAKAWCEQITTSVGSCYARNVGWDSSFR